MSVSLHVSLFLMPGKFSATVDQIRHVAFSYSAESHEGQRNRAMPLTERTKYHTVNMQSADKFNVCYFLIYPQLQRTLLVWHQGRAPGLQKMSDEVLVWLSVCSEVQIACIWSS